MFEEERWATLLAGQGCPLCGETERIILTTLPSGRVELVNDGNFVGYCILVFHRHAIELFDLSQEERTQFMEDITRIAEAIATVCQPGKLNYEMLGNMVPHLHCHIVPRYPNDGYWGGPLWARPADAIPTLTTDVLEALAEELRTALTCVPTTRH